MRGNIHGRGSPDLGAVWAGVLRRAVVFAVCLPGAGDEARVAPIQWQLRLAKKEFMILGQLDLQEYRKKCLYADYLTSLKIAGARSALKLAIATTIARTGWLSHGEGFNTICSLTLVE